MTIKYLLSRSPEALRAAIAGKRSVSVEAEFGDEIVEGSLLTLGHHGPREANPPPCVSPNLEIDDVDVVAFSHIDLDALGGALAALGMKPGPASFWRLAGFIDTHGAHKLGESGASERDISRLYAWWAWNEKHPLKLPREKGEVVDVSDHFANAFAAILAIMLGDSDALAEGRAFRKEGELLNVASFVRDLDGVVFRISERFVNHFYVLPDGEVAKACVGFNDVAGRVTVSLADPIPGISCREIVQRLWGPKAGGHEGIAGSPYEAVLTREDAERAFVELRRALREAE